MWRRRLLRSSRGRLMLLGSWGRGSEVLGYDDSMSTDHTWSARVIVFVPGEVLVEQGESVKAG